MATIAVGDIHGHRRALDDVLGQIAGEVDDGDAVVFLGDYIDGGPQSKECIDAILTFRGETEAEVITLCGTHEEWLLRTLRDFRRHSWLLGMEAYETIHSYSPDAARTLRDAATAAGYELIASRPPLPYHVFFDHMPK